MPPGRRPTPPPRPRGATGFQPPARNTMGNGGTATGSPNMGLPASSYMNPAYQTAENKANFAEYGNAGGSVLGPGANDPWNNMTPDQYFAALMGATGVNAGAGGGSGGRGGGGGAAAKPGDPDPLGWNAIAQQQALEKGYAEMLAAQDAKNKALSAGFDSRTAGLNTANQAGADQMARLQAQLAQQASATQGQVAQSYQGGQAALQGILGQYQQMIQGRQAPAAQTLQAFGAAPGAAVADPSGVQNMLVAQQANLARVGQADDALFANRGNVYNGLNQDVTTQRQQGFDMLMAKLLAEQQATSAAGASERAQLAMQQQQQMLQLQAQEQARRASYG